MITNAQVELINKMVIKSNSDFFVIVLKTMSEVVDLYLV